MSYAAYHEALKILKWLFENGADPNDSDPYESGEQALYWSIFGRRQEVTQILVEAGATVVTRHSTGRDATPLHQAAKDGSGELVKYLLEKAEGAKAFRIFDDCDASPLHWAIRGRNLETATVLLEAGHDPDALVQVHEDCRIGWPPINEAVRDGNIEMTKLLLSYGADPDRPGWMWTTARHRLDKLEEPVRSEMAALLDVKPLKKLNISPHCEEIESQLLADLAFHGLNEFGISWRSSKVNGATVQVAGERIAPFSNIRLTDKDGQVVGRGEFDFIVLTVDLNFRAFWTKIELEDCTVRSDSENIPKHVWEKLDSDQRSWALMDSRNHKYRYRAGTGQRKIEGQLYT